MGIRKNERMYGAMFVATQVEWLQPSCTCKVNDIRNYWSNKFIFHFVQPISYSLDKIEGHSKYKKKIVERK